MNHDYHDGKTCKSIRYYRSKNGAKINCSNIGGIMGEDSCHKKSVSHFTKYSLFSIISSLLLNVLTLFQIFQSSLSNLAYDLKNSPYKINEPFSIKHSLPHCKLVKKKG